MTKKEENLDDDNWTFIPWDKPSCTCIAFAMFGKCPHTEQENA